MNDSAAAGARVREARKRIGLTQRELARSSGVSVSLITKLEQGEYGGIRLETVRKLAVVLGVATSALMSEPDAPAPDAGDAGRWEPVRRAIDGEHREQPGGMPTLEGIRSALAGVTPLLVNGKLAEIGAVLPALLRDADALVSASPASERMAAKSLRAQARQMAGSLMLHAWQFDAADRAFDMAMGDACDPLTAMSVVEERCWGLIRQGRLTETRELAFQWADLAEPKMSVAGREQMAAWGRLLMRASAAAVRDNRPDEARDALRLVQMAAACAGRDYVLSYSPWHVFGPVTASVTAAENAAKSGQPDVTLAIARQLEGAGLRRVHRFSPSHRLDVAHAHATLRQYPEAIKVLQELRQARPQWLPQQRYARDILSTVIRRRRTLTSEMRDLAGFLSLPL
jgi:transcriptional regulator with XRE-family HTH domain